MALNLNAFNQEESTKKEGINLSAFDRSLKEKDFNFSAFGVEEPAGVLSTPQVKQTFLEQAPERSLGDKFSDFLRSNPVTQPVVEGLFGIPTQERLELEERDEGIVGDLKRRGIVGFFFQGLLKPEIEQIGDRFNALVDEGIEPDRATRVAIQDVRKNKLALPTFDSVQQSLEQEREEVEITERERNALKRVGFFEKGEQALELLDLPTLGVFGFTRKTAGKTLKRKVLKELAENTSESVARNVLKRELPGAADNLIDDLARATTRSKTTNDVAEVITKQVEDVARNVASGRTAREIVEDSTIGKARPTVSQIRRTVEGEPAPFVRRRETTLLKERIRNLSRGAREGQRIARAEIRGMQDEVIDLAVDNLPVALRGDKSFLTKIRNANSPQKLEKSLNAVSERIEEFQEAQRVLREEGTRRSKIAFIKKVGEFNQTTINDVKKAIDIDKPIGKMNTQELDAMVGELRNRLSFKAKRGFRPQVKKRGTEIPQIENDAYSLNRDLQGNSTASFRERTKEGLKDIGNFADELGGSLSTRLGNIDNVLKQRLRKFEFDVRKTTQKDQEVVREFLEKVHGKKSLKKLGKREGGMNQEDFVDFDFAAKNGDINKMEELADKYNFKKEFSNIRKILDDVYKRAEDVGFDIGYQKNYLPRTIKDVDGFLNHIQNTENWSAIGTALKRKEMDLGRYLTNEEKAHIINNMIRGYSGGQITLSKTGAMKERIIDFVDPELNTFYARFDDALNSYVIQTNEAIETRRFFGKEFKNATDPQGLNNLNDSIGAYTADLLAKGKITLQQEQELSRLLKARFAENGITNPALGIYKTAAYIDVLGGLDNAITQIGDLGLAMYAGGIRKGFGEGLRSLFGKSRLTKEEIGFAAEEISAEFSKKGKLKRTLDTVFRLTGFRKIDKLGAEALANSTIRGLQQQARNPNAKFLAKIEDAFPEEIFGSQAQKNLIQDLAKGNITEDVKFVAFNNVLDFSPRALSEMPEKYLTGGNGRIFYMLQSWTLKLLDVYRRESFQLIKQGQKAEGLKNLLRLTATVGAMNASADIIKDFMMGREIKPDELAIDNMLKLAGFSRYTKFQIEREGLFSAITSKIQPGAAPLIDNASKDVMNLFKDFDKSADINELRSVRSIPVGGDMYYWWFGKGTETKNRNTGGGVGVDIEIPEIEIPEVEIPEVNIPEVSI